MAACLRYISLQLLLLLAATAYGQRLFPQSEGERMRYQATIEMERGYVSGVCVAVCDADGVRGCLFNEFGITALDFSYDPVKDRVRLHGLVAMLDHWYIRRTLRRDLRSLIHCLQQGQTTYENRRRHISYTFTPLTDDSEQ